MQEFLLDEKNKFLVRKINFHCSILHCQFGLSSGRLLANQPNVVLFNVSINSIPVFQFLGLIFQLIPKKLSISGFDNSIDQFGSTSSSPAQCSFLAGLIWVENKFSFFLKFYHRLGKPNCVSASVINWILRPVFPINRNW